MRYEELLNEAENSNVYVIENVDFESQSDGLINGNVIGISRKVRSYRKRSCVLAEELGHYHTAVGDILDQSTVENRKLERRGRVWSYDKIVGLTGIISCYHAGCHTLFEMAEHLEVPEDFLQEALNYYRSKYGICTKLDNYTIFFESGIAVLELL